MATTRTTRTTKTDRERAEEQAQSVERDDNFQLPPGVSTKASRGEVETDTSEPSDAQKLVIKKAEYHRVTTGSIIQYPEPPK